MSVVNGPWTAHVVAYGPWPCISMAYGPRTGGLHGLGPVIPTVSRAAGHRGRGPRGPRPVRRTGFGSAGSDQRLRFSLFGSDGERLGPALHLCAPVLAQGLRGGAGQAVVGGEEPLQHLLVGEAVVPQERQGAAEALDDLVPVDEGSGDVQRAVLTPAYGDELALLDQLPHPGHLDVEHLRDVGQGEPGGDESIGLCVNLGHGNKPAIPH